MLRFLCPSGFTRVLSYRFMRKIWGYQMGSLDPAPNGQERQKTVNSRYLSGCHRHEKSGNVDYRLSYQKKMLEQRRNDMLLGHSRPRLPSTDAEYSIDPVDGGRSGGDCTVEPPQLRINRDCSILMSFVKFDGEVE
uniref:Uncharacterized protein n=1 Tax=Solanum lycopersicum TaxID=4081 RepID=A0A3Q7HI80_SOLLC